jgi:hypothetical protein
MGCEFLSIKYTCNENPDVSDATEGTEETVCVCVCVCVRARTRAPAPTTNDFELIFYQVRYNLCSINFSVALSQMYILLPL